MGAGRGGVYRADKDEGAEEEEEEEEEEFGRSMLILLLNLATSNVQGGVGSSYLLVCTLHGPNSPRPSVPRAFPLNHSRADRALVQSAGSPSFPSILWVHNSFKSPKNHGGPSLDLLLCERQGAIL